MTNEEKAKQIIEENIYCTVATASPNGKPWASPVFFAYDEGYNLFWVSDKNSLHSTYIRSNPQIAIAIFNSQAPEGEGDGVYMEAKVQELFNEEEIREAMDILNKRVTLEEFRVKRLGEVTGDGIWRVYKATPEKFYKLSEGEYINGQYIDTRVEVNLLK